MKCQSTLNWRRKGLLWGDWLVLGKALWSCGGWQSTTNSTVGHSAVLAVCWPKTTQQWLFLGNGPSSELQRSAVHLWGLEEPCSAAVVLSHGVWAADGAEGTSIPLSPCPEIQVCIKSKTPPRGGGMGGKAGITSMLPVSVLWLSQPGKGHWTSLESNVAATNIKRDYRGQFLFLVLQGKDSTLLQHWGYLGKKMSCHKG